MDLMIRTASSADAAIVAEFNSRLAWETEQRRLEPDRVLSGVTALLNDPTKGSYYLAEINVNGAAVVAGQLLITYEWSDWRNGNFWWIQSVYVAAEHRGSGVFRSLYQYVHRLAAVHPDVCGLRLYVENHNAPAQQAYLRLGMKRSEYQMYELDFVLTGGASA